MRSDSGAMVSRWDSGGRRRVPPSSTVGSLLREWRREPYRVLPPPRPNALKLLFGPLKALIVNSEEVTRDVLARARHEAATDRDPVRKQIVEECLQAAPPDWRGPRPEDPPRLVLEVDARLGEHRARLFSTICTLGTAQDITLQELRVESFYPRDAESEQLFRALAAQ